jgi:ATP phosphoribosyltransferase regulatory subunit
MAAWVLPDHIADVLPSEARRIEELRRELLDMARCYGYELVMPPMLEHLESLLTGTGQELNLQTFKLVDQLSGRSLGLRADTTPQVARIDAHLLNRQGVTRLCYCGPVLHARPSSPHATREPLQFGAEIYGHAGLEADLEAIELALDSLHIVGVKSVILDVADVRVVNALVQGLNLSPEVMADLHTALSVKDSTWLQKLTLDMPDAARKALAVLPSLYGDASVLEEAERVLPSSPLMQQALSQLKWLAQHLPDTNLSFDLADLSGYAYYSGLRFAVYATGQHDAILRGGRYDEVGAVFGRKRPAVGFSLDLKTLVGLVPEVPVRAAIRAPWNESQSLRQAIVRLRGQGETVVRVLPGHESEILEFHCDRELREIDGQWKLLQL